MVNLIIIEAIPKTSNFVVWIPFTVIFALVLVAYVKQKNDSISVSINSFFNLRFFRQSIREETNASLKYSRILLLNSFIVTALILNHFLGKDIANLYLENNELILPLLFVFVVLWYFFNSGIKKIVSSISNTASIEVEQQRYNQYFFQTLGLFLLPGAIGLYFFPSSLFSFKTDLILEFYIKLVSIILILNKIIQSVLQSFEIKISWVYIFLYICTLEILPLCVGFQLLVR